MQNNLIILLSSLGFFVVAEIVQYKLCTDLIISEPTLIKHFSQVAKPEVLKINSTWTRLGRH